MVFWGKAGDEILYNYIVIVDTQLCKYYKNQSTLYSERIKLMVCELFFFFILKKICVNCTKTYGHVNTLSGCLTGSKKTFMIVIT